MGDTSPAPGQLMELDDTESPTPAVNPMRRRLLVLVLLLVVVLSGLLGGLGYGYYKQLQNRQAEGEFLQAARQGALNLTTIDWEQADADVQRIMDGATGTFYDDFATRSQPFVDVVKQAKSVSVGTVTEAGLESRTGDEAQALVAVSVKTSSSAGAEPVPRAWRMRIAVQRIDGQFKVSRVEFVA